MFPLGSVLFPHMPIALRVFEDRYLVMLARVLDTDDPQFGVVLIEHGHETGGGDRRFRIGTMAHITEVSSGDDHVSLVARGGRRVEVLDWLEDDPHPVAIVRELPDFEWDDALAAMHEEAEHIVRRTLARTTEFAQTSWGADVQLSDDPIESAWQLAAIAPLGPIDQLALLQSGSPAELLTSLTALTLAAEPALTAAPADTEFDEAVAALLGFGEEPDEAAPGGGTGPDRPGAPS